MDKISIIILVVKLLFVYPMFMGPLDLLISLPLGKGIMVLNCVFIISIPVWYLLFASIIDFIILSVPSMTNMETEAHKSVYYKSHFFPA